ncbi:MAG TPA: helix-turn-helix transcriptional regulator [Chitinophagaceae bacterium]|nr:helix-turn-helix transcriptional regulator [Chitinophagaceae bacterium]
MNIKRLSSKFTTDRELADYWARLKPDENLTPEDEERWKKRASFLENISAQNNVALMLWNAYTNRFVFMSDKWAVLGGYSPEMYTGEKGLAFSISKIHPDFLPACLLMNEKGIQYISRNPGIPVNKIFISLNLNYLKKDGTYFQILQQSVIVETDKKRQPLLALSYISDISHIKKPGCADMIISSPAGAEIYTYDFEMKTLIPVKSLSEKEKNILIKLSTGMDTKKIAQAVNVSPNTVDTHRRNIIKKTNCIDTTAAVTYARLTGII